jgi:hypothetical protein
MFRDPDNDGRMNFEDSDMDGDGTVDSLDDDMDGDMLPNGIDYDVDDDGPLFMNGNEDRLDRDIDKD